MSLHYPSKGLAIQTDSKEKPEAEDMHLGVTTVSENKPIKNKRHCLEETERKKRVVK